MKLAVGHIKDYIIPESEEEVRLLLGDYRAGVMLRQKTAKGRALSFCAGMTLKSVLLAEDIDITCEEFCFGENEKPMLRDRPEVFFNLSHSGELALAVSCDVPVGCDIQRIEEKPVSHLERLAKRFFTEIECRMLEGSSEDEDAYRTAFYLVFSAKESFIKCTGEGLKRQLSSFEVPVPFAGADRQTYGNHIIRAGDVEYSLDYYFPDDVRDFLSNNLPCDKYVAAVCNKKG